MDKTKRIVLWSGPRNISTALMYSFAQRSDTKVFDEPLYGYYLNESNADEYHPGAKEVLNEMETNGQKVIDMMMGPHAADVVFFKHMTHHQLELDRSFMKDCINVILTRDPREMLTSIAKVIAHPKMSDIGYLAHLDILNEIKTLGQEPIVLDSKGILKDPQGVLKALCEKVGIPFHQKMLSWEPGPRPEDGSWAKYWYDNVHRSSGFSKYIKKDEAFPTNLKPLFEESMPCYEELIIYAIGD